jgi:hypothetical protein
MTPEEIEQFELELTPDKREKIAIASDAIFSLLRNFPLPLDEAESFVVLNMVIGMVCAFIEREPDKELHLVNKRTVELSYKMHVRLFAEEGCEGTA